MNLEAWLTIITIATISAVIAWWNTRCSLQVQSQYMETLMRSQGEMNRILLQSSVEHARSFEMAIEKIESMIQPPVYKVKYGAPKLKPVPEKVKVKVERKPRTQEQKRLASEQAKARWVLRKLKQQQNAAPSA